VSQFPVQTNPFLGRAQSLADLNARLANPDCRLLTLIGTGGSGKTRLAIQVAEAAQTLFPHGVYFVGLQPLSSGELLVPTIARTLGISFYGSMPPEQQLYERLHDKSLLLVLDNFEHLLDKAPLVSELLANAPHVKLLVTSREMLNLQEEWLYPLKGMQTPLSSYSSQLQDYEAVQFFLYHARRMQPNFSLEDNLEAVVRICQVAEGLPLALELAATWLKGLLADQIAAEMQHNLDFLTTTVRNVEERHRSMRATFDQSWKLLSKDERLAFAKLSVFRGGFDHEAAEQVTGASLQMLMALVEKSLIQTVTSVQFGIHELLRQYGAEKLDKDGETQATLAKHSHYYAQRMRRYDSALKQPEQLKAIRGIEDDFENIRQAWNWSAQNQIVANLHAMLDGLYLFGYLRSRYREITGLFEQGLEECITDTALLGRLLARRWGYLHWVYQEDYEKPFALIEQAYQIASAANNQFEMAFCDLAKAFALIGMHRYADALPPLEKSRELFNAVDDPYYMSWALHRLGYCYYNLNEPEKANKYTEQSLALARITNNRATLVTCLLNLGSHCLKNSQYIKGRNYIEESLQVATEAGHQGQTAHALSLLALCAFFHGDYAACWEYAQRSQVINENIRPRIFQPYNQSLLILLACLDEDYAEGLHISEAGTRHTIDKMGFQLLYWSLAALSCGLGNLSAARDTIVKLFEISAPDETSVTSVWLVPSAVYVLAEKNPEKAVELLAWVFTYDDLALSWVRQWSLFERLQTQLQDKLGTHTYQMHWEQGTRLSTSAVEAYLLREFRTSDADIPDTGLTARESEILALMATGLTNPQIAEQLFIGLGTVKTHTLSIYRKLDVANRSQAIIRAQQLGLIPYQPIK
jgi:predicted ATPase/DNA-binding CsgD family transcriptional regulator